MEEFILKKKLNYIGDIKFMNQNNKCMHYGKRLMKRNKKKMQDLEMMIMIKYLKISNQADKI